MSVVDTRELQEGLEDLVRRVDENGETIAITRRGRVAVLMVKAPATAPDADQPSWRDETEAGIAALDRLADEIAAVWPRGVSALDAVNDIRRDT